MSVNNMQKPLKMSNLEVILKKNGFIFVLTLSASQTTFFWWCNQEENDVN